MEGLKALRACAPIMMMFPGQVCFFLLSAHCCCILYGFQAVPHKRSFDAMLENLYTFLFVHFVDIGTRIYQI